MMYTKQRPKGFGIRAAARGAGRVFLPVAVLLLSVAGCKDSGPAAADGGEYAIEKKFERGPLTVTVKVERETLSIADTVRVRLEAVIDEGYEVTMPAVAEFLAKENRLGILDYQTEPDALQEGNRLLAAREYRLEPIVSGSYAIPALKFVFREKEGTATGADTSGPEPPSQETPEQTPPKEEPDKTAGETEGEAEKTYELLTEAIGIKVTSLLDEQRGDLTIADIKDLASPPETRSWWWLWIVGALAGAGGIGAAVIWLRGRQQRKELRIMQAAHEVAYARLRRLTEENLIEAGRIKEFYERISSILRTYIEHRFRLRAPERTTEEFLAEMQTTDVIGPEQKKMLETFLQHCDLVKFAQYGPTPVEIQKTFDLTKGFIEATRISEKQVDVTDQIRKAENESLVRSA